LKYHRLLEQNEAQRPDQALLRIGWNPEDVSLVILTHLHWDHWREQSTVQAGSIHRSGR